MSDGPYDLHEPHDPVALVVDEMSRKFERKPPLRDLPGMDLDPDLVHALLEEAQVLYHTALIDHEDELDPIQREPGGTVTNPPVGALRVVYRLVRRWWIENTRFKTFRPDYPFVIEKVKDRLSYPPDSPERQRHECFINPPGYFFLLVAQVLDPGYTETNCASVHDAMRHSDRVHDPIINP